MITISKMSFKYSKVDIFKDIDLQFEQGHIYGLLGENGVGKTTLLKIICGLQPPYSGQCEVDGHRSFDRLPQMLENMTFIPDTIHTTEGSTPRKHIRALAPFYPRYDEQQFIELAQQLNIDVDMKFKTMSHGMQKKAILAGALSLNTNYLLLDEPTNGLDIPSKVELRRILASVANEDRTIIISTHQVKDVENLIDSVVILTQQDVLLNAGISEIEQRLTFEYSEHPIPGAIYTEQQPNGYMNVVENTNGDESQINIETLFNAVTHNHIRIKNTFNCQ